MQPAYLPTPAQAALLRACLLEGDAARAGYREWRSAVVLDDVDGASRRLLPLLAARWPELGIDDPQIGRYRGVQRFAWAKNQRLFETARRVVGLLAANDVPSLLLKGAVLSTVVYPSPSMRPIGDLDLMVPRRLAGTALATLERAGWRTDGDRPQGRADFANRHAATLIRRGEDGAELDLHWRLLPWHADKEAEASLWEFAQPLPAVGPGALMPSSADLLLHVLAHGTRWNPLPPIRWVADAAMLLRRGNIDWDRFVAQVRRYQLVLPVRATLDYLASEGFAAVPSDCRERLGELPVTALDRTVFDLEQIPYDRRPLPLLARVHARRCWTLAGRTPAALLRYLHAVFERRSMGATLRWIMHRAMPRPAS